MKQQYSLNDLTIRPTHQQKNDEGMTEHTHKIIFKHPLNLEEKQQFIQLIKSIQQLIAPSQLEREQVIFTTDNQVDYQLKQPSLSGEWKNLLFAKLAVFSTEVSEILEHDGNRVFSKIATKHEQRELNHRKNEPIQRI
ncbi:hypothetical protein C7H19_24305 [Aphanothece hegewaldii CCALA 016]|uniref:Uncharacterized protein n=1 Tax=Aphanothece hegewaldii CCALA 016 TaxID=2107694 RepID=A0A2T1LQR4_9CHRO|nr:hypothetical protein [Aphanothece hegewaldii]PSF29445.1 hypothetical protein C7H19_24305 [Aphanothece hegewaldii CCALA 016]